MNMISEKLCLTEEQTEAVKHFCGPALVVAGPGSGKTMVMSRRAKYLINEKDVLPKNILVTTFTEKAANQLKVRLSKTIGKKAARINISTIHSLYKTSLERYAMEHDLGAGFEVLDNDAQKLFVQVNKFNLGIFRRKWLKGKKVEEFIGLYNFLTRNDIDIEELENALIEEGEFSDENHKVINSYKKYLDLLKRGKKIDFDNLELRFYRLICDKEGKVLEDIRKRFQFILIDEYQDTNSIQDKIFRKIAAPENNIFVVGDSNQSIYGFRGASIQNFINFNKNYPNTKTYYLSTNFRSTENITELSNKVFKEKVIQELKSRRRKGEKSILITDETADSVAEKAIDLVIKMRDNGIIKKYGDVALLFRNWSHSKEYVKYLRQKGIPYVTLGGGGLIDRVEVKTMLYLISYVVNKKLCLSKKFIKWDSWWNISAFNTEVLGFSAETKKALDNLKTDLYKLKNKSDLNGIGIIDDRDINKIIKLNELRKKYDEKVYSSPLEVFYKILDCAGYMNRLLVQDDDRIKEKLFNLAKLSEFISKYEGMNKNDIIGFYWFIYSLSDKLDQIKIENENTVKIMTIHKAKGLEFPVVFICSLLKGRLPMSFRKEQFILPIPDRLYLNQEEVEHKKKAFYEEERRIFYVGITRAQDNLILTSSDKINTQRRDKSKFLKEIEGYLSTETDLKLQIENTYNVVKNTPNLNHSAINTYIDCPFRYNLVYNYGFVTSRSSMQNRGIFMHSVVQEINHELKCNHDVKEGFVEELVDKYWIPVHQDKDKDNRFKMKNLQYLKLYCSNAPKLYKKIIAIEEPFTYITDSMIINGRIDLIAEDINGNINLVDFKARKAKGKNGENIMKDTGVDKQLEMYDYCLGDKYKINKLCAYTLMDQEITEFMPEKENIKKFLRRMADRMNKESFEKNNGALCKICDFSFCCGDTP